MFMDMIVQRATRMVEGPLGLTNRVREAQEVVAGGNPDSFRESFTRSSIADFCFGKLSIQTCSFFAGHRGRRTLEPGMGEVLQVFRG
jgi:hypothetical protein